MAVFWLWIGSAVAFFGSLIAQHIFNMDPCSWCIMQRLAAGLTWGLLTVVWILPRQVATFVKGLAGLTWLSGLLAAGYQSYVFYAGDVFSCGSALDAKLSFFSVDYPWTAWLVAPTAMCSTANFVVMGLPVSMWSLTGFLVLLIGYIGWTVAEQKPSFL